MNNYISNIWKPYVYHGEKKRGEYFEGWFYKLVSKDGKSIIAVINGVFKSKDPSKEHAFIQVLNGVNQKADYIRYPIEAFSFDNNDFSISIGTSSFSKRHISLDIRSDKRTIYGEVAFGTLKPWPVTVFSPGVMGWFGFVPFMQTNHGVLSMDHSLKGALKLNRKTHTFDKGRGYIEKDWGSSFPSSYVWVQSNHFPKRGVSLSGSIATIPWVTKSFRGFIVGLQIGKNLYRFTTYTGAKLNMLTIKKKNIFFEVEDRKYKLSVSINRKESGLLYGPYDKEMVPKVSESLNSEVQVTLVHRDSGRTVYKGMGLHAGLDVNGNLKDIAY